MNNTIFETKSQMENAKCSMSKKAKELWDEEFNSSLSGRVRSWAKKLSQDLKEYQAPVLKGGATWTA